MAEVSSSSETKQRPKKETSKWLMKLMELNTKVISQTEVNGIENIEKIPEGTNIIIATTHTSDLDVPIVIKTLGHILDLAITDMSIHRSLKQSFKSIDPTIAGIYLAGKNNFLPISYFQGKGERRGRIDPKDTENIKTTLKKGKAVTIAGHNPTFNGMLPDNAGYLVIRAAQLIEGTVVVPVAVQVGEPWEKLGMANNIWETARKKPKAKINIGQPLIFDNQETKKARYTIEEVLKRRKQGIRQPEDATKLKKAREIFNKDGERLMKSLASLMPPEKRGKWG